HATDYDGLTVSDQHLGVHLVLPDRRNTTSTRGLREVWLVLGNLDLHDNPVIWRDLRCYLQGKRCLLEGSAGCTAGTGFLIGYFGALENLCRFLIGSDNLGLRNHLAVTCFFHRRQLEIKNSVIAYEAQANTRGSAGSSHIHKRQVERSFYDISFSFTTFFQRQPFSTPTVGTPVVVEVYITAPFNAQALVIVHVRLDDPRFDHHLAYRNIQLRHDATQLVQSFLCLIGDDVVGAIIDCNRAAIFCRGPITGHRLEQTCNVGGLGIIGLHYFTTQRR